MSRPSFSFEMEVLLMRDRILWFKRYLKRKYVKLTKRAHETMAGLGLMM